MSQRDMARKLDLDEGDFSRLVRGLRTPTASQIRSIQQATGGKIAFEDWFVAPKEGVA